MLRNKTVIEQIGRVLVRAFGLSYQLFETIMTSM